LGRVQVLPLELMQSCCRTFYEENKPATKRILGEVKNPMTRYHSTKMFPIRPDGARPFYDFADSKPRLLFRTNHHDRTKRHRLPQVKRTILEWDGIEQISHFGWRFTYSWKANYTVKHWRNTINQASWSPLSGNLSEELCLTEVVIRTSLIKTKKQII
jgi:hypothetical protein